MYVCQECKTIYTLNKEQYDIIESCIKHKAPRSILAECPGCGRQQIHGGEPDHYDGKPCIQMYSHSGNTKDFYLISEGYNKVALEAKEYFLDGNCVRLKKRKIDYMEHEIDTDQYCCSIDNKYASDEDYLHIAERIIVNTLDETIHCLRCATKDRIPKLKECIEKFKGIRITHTCKNTPVKIILVYDHNEFFKKMYVGDKFYFKGLSHED